MRALAAGSLSAAVCACSGDPAPVGAGDETGGEAGAASGGAGGSGAAGGSGGARAVSTGGSGGDEVPGGVHFMVPEGGGAVRLPTRSGAVVEFEFPASAAGLAIALTPSDAASIGWPEGQFTDVIEMAPDGTVFDEPVIVRPALESDLVLHFSDGAAEPELLPRNEGGEGVALSHFSTIATLPGKDCRFLSSLETDLPLLPCLALTHLYSEFRCMTPDNCMETSVSCCSASLTGECGRYASYHRYRMIRYDPNRNADGVCDGGMGSGGAGGGGGEGAAAAAGAPGSGGTGEPGVGGSSGAGGSGSGGMPDATPEGGSAGSAGPGDPGADGRGGDGGSGMGIPGYGGGYGGSGGTGSGGTGSDGTGSDGTGSDGTGSGGTETPDDPPPGGSMTEVPPDGSGGGGGGEGAAGAAGAPGSGGPSGTVPVAP